MSWPTAALGEIAKIERNSIAPADIASGSRYVGLEHIGSGGGSLSFGKVSNGELASNKFRFGPQHILFGKLRPYLAKIVCPDFEGICSTDILPIAPGKRIHQHYLLHFLRRPKTIDWASSRATGVNLPRLSPNELASLEIPLPPLDEQRRIAAILDKADDLRRKRKHALELLDGLTQSIFLEMFGDPVQNTEGWPVKKVEKLSQRVSKGESPGWQGFEYQNKGVRFITSENIGWGKIIRKDKFIPEAFNRKIKRSILLANDLLINLVGASIGRAALMEERLLPANINQAVAVVSLNESSILPEFALQQILTPYIQTALLGEAVEAARANLSLTNIRELELLVPPIKTQQQFVARIDQIKAQIVFCKNSLESHEAMFSSLQSRAFSGQL